MDWEDYRYLLGLSRHQTLSATATALGVVRTTVGRRLQATEEAIGARLFDRTPDGFVPTPAGEELIAVAREMEAQVLAAEARVMGRDAELSGSLRVSTLDFIYEHFVDVFESFINRYPGVSLTVCSTPEQVSLRRRQADVVLRLNDAPAPYLVGRRLRTMHFSLYASRQLVERMGPEAPLSSYPFLGDDDRSSDAWTDAWLAQTIPGARVSVRYDGYAVMRASVRAGLGAHLLPRVQGERDPELIAIAPEIPPITRALWVLTLADLRTNTRVRAFMAHVADALSEPDQARPRPDVPPTSSKQI